MVFNGSLSYLFLHSTRHNVPLGILRVRVKKILRGEGRKRVQRKRKRSATRVTNKRKKVKTAKRINPKKKRKYKSRTKSKLFG